MSRSVQWDALKKARIIFVNTNIDTHGYCNVMSILVDVKKKYIPNHSQFFVYYIDLYITFIIKFWIEILRFWLAQIQKIASTVRVQYTFAILK